MNKTLLMVTMTLISGTARAECEPETRLGAEAPVSELMLAIERSVQADRRLAAAIETAVAREPGTPEPALPACADHDLRAAFEGFKCRTSKGTVWERVRKDGFGEAWKGPSGWIWSDLVRVDTRRGAEVGCDLRGGRLPSRSEFLLADLDGFREVLPNMKDRRYWTSTNYPYNDRYGYDFDAVSGYVEPSGPLESYKSGVRCVSI